MSRIIGQVAAVMNERELVVNRGSEQGVRREMVFHVLDRPVPIIDPETKLELGTVCRPKIRVKVTKVENKFAIARTFETYQVNEGGNLLGFAPANVFNPPKLVTKARTLRYDETGLDYAPLTTTETFIKVGDIVEEAEPPPIMGIDSILREIPQELIPADGRWSPASIIKSNEILQRNVLSKNARFQLAAEAIGAVPDGRYAGIMRFRARLPYSDTAKLHLLIWIYFNDATDSTKQRFGVMSNGSSINVAGTIRRADLDGSPKTSLNIDLFDSMFAD